MNEMNECAAAAAAVVLTLWMCTLVDVSQI